MPLSYILFVVYALSDYLILKAYYGIIVPVGIVRARYILTLKIKKYFCDEVI